MLRIVVFKDMNLKGFTLVEGFPGVGLVGPMTSSYVVEKLHMEYIGYIESDVFPPIAVIHGGVPMYSARIYVDTKLKLLVVLSEFVIPAASVYQLSMEILSFVKEKGIGRIVSVNGMPSFKPAENAYIVSTEKAMIKKATGVLKPINEGVVAGVSAVLLSHGGQQGIPVTNILVEVNPSTMDPKNAELAITGLNKILGINIDLKELEAEAAEVEAKVRELMKKTRDTHEHYTKATEAAGPPMYA